MSFAFGTIHKRRRPLGGWFDVGFFSTKMPICRSRNSMTLKVKKNCQRICFPNVCTFLQGEDNVLVLQTEDIVRLVLKIHENDINTI